ncbi:MAG: hypothetical protein U1E62_23060 [Alsobacter sp.]
MRYGKLRQDERDPNCAAFYPPGLLDEARRALSRLADIGFRYDHLRERTADRVEKDDADLMRRLTSREAREKREPLARLQTVHRKISQVMRLDLRRAA